MGKFAVYFLIILTLNLGIAVATAQEDAFSNTEVPILSDPSLITSDFPLPSVPILADPSLITSDFPIASSLILSDPSLITSDFTTAKSPILSDSSFAQSWL